MTLLAAARAQTEFPLHGFRRSTRLSGEQRGKKVTKMNYYNARKPIGTTARTGEVCPESGVWQSIDTPSTTAPIAKGNRMPPHNGKSVTWKLVRHA
ncbi:hypothetical protein [Novosphingobium sp. ERN07]|uniref:hypothetical protein n=1 Tax=Novosphingobium sp. ERN07 TaxID=2726187 RepID=UPI00197D4A2E|nr:hypothetical protein [Novosphingobium sp. ERN07]